MRPARKAPARCGLLAKLISGFAARRRRHDAALDNVRQLEGVVSRAE